MIGRRPNARLSLALIASLASAVVGCARERPDAESLPASHGTHVAADGRVPAPVHVDSILPIEEHLRRFRDGLGREPQGLSGGATSREALVQRFVDALATSDTAAFADMALDAAEFAWLYYPHTRFAAPPYRQAPEILWMQIQNGSSRGIHRLLDRLGGVRLHVDGPRCEGPGAIEGPNRVWEGCVLLVTPPNSEPVEMRLFGSILERDGTFEFVSFRNDF